MREKSDGRSKNLPVPVANEDLLIHEATSPNTVKKLLQVRLTANEMKNEAMRKRGLRPLTR